MRRVANSLLVILALAAIAGAAMAEPPANVGTYHGDKDRGGLYVVPGLTQAVAAGAAEDADFYGAVIGNVYAQPLYWRRPGAAHGVIAVATSSNYVYALNSKTGNVVWRTFLGPPVAKAALPCGNIDPLGVTGTPAIRDDGVIWLDAMVLRASGPRHMIFALSMLDGTVLPGYPINVTHALAGLGLTFDPTVQNQRSALTIVDDRLYVPYGGLSGDCGTYHGWVVGVDLATSRIFGGWATRAPLGGIWGQGGIAFDGTSLLVATGNTRHTDVWGDGEAIIRLPADLSHSSSTRDYFSPADWHTLDNEDLDLGGTGPVPLDVPTATGGTQALVLALGKDGDAYLLHRNDLGGISAPLVKATVAGKPIITAPAVYPLGNAVAVAFHGTCGSAAGVSAITVTAGTPPSLASAWCTPINGAGAPIVTTTDGHGDPIVWAVGAQGDNALHAYAGANGAALYTGPALAGLHRYQTILVAENRLFIAGDNRVYAFDLGL